jgi:hypothetical protein
MRTSTCRSTFLYGQNTHKLQFNLMAITKQIICLLNYVCVVEQCSDSEGRVADN